MPRSSTSRATTPRKPLRVVGIGASAGGLEAFTELVKALPTEASLTYVLVQHLDPTHRSLLSELLARSASLPVEEIADGTAVAPNRIYVIPPKSDLTIQDGVLKLSPRDTKAGPARSIDRFLSSLAADQGPQAVGVILSGAGSDGAKGLKDVKDAGGLTFAQDEKSSKYSSMPRSAIALNCVDFVLPPARIAAELTRIDRTPGKIRRRAAANARNRRGRVSRLDEYFQAPEGESPPWPKAPRDADLKKIFALLRARTAMDFGCYRLTTVRRRIHRRLQAHRMTELPQYVRLLRESPAEVEALYQDLLISVTRFFRNPGIFETVKRKVFPRLVRREGPDTELRFWVAGCSTGQEAYSFAIAFVEYCEKAGIRPHLQIFATDTNPAVLERARAGYYTDGQLEGLSGARRQRFFLREGEGYRVQKLIRDLVVFAQHNLLTDAPFTRMNLVSCRNMMIYIEPALQQKILPTFHYALRPDGYLVLGTSESIGSFTNLFSTAERSQKIYQKKATGRGERLPLPAGRPVLVSRRADSGPNDVFREADRVMLARYIPAALLLNDEGDILQVRGKVDPFLEIPAGRATLNVFKLLRGGSSLSVPLQRAMGRARIDGRPASVRDIAVEGLPRPVHLEVTPLKGMQARCFLVLLEQAPAPAAPARPGAGRAAAPGRVQTRRLTTLKREYAETRDSLDQLREQHETTVEELQASNEEVQSANEELQSLNEELETSNEELESANEELTTLNEELATRNVELRESEQRLREQAQLVEMAPLLARNTKDRVIFWSRGAERLYGYTKEEALGQNSHLLLGAQYPEPLETISAHLAERGRWDGEVTHRRKDGTSLTVSAQWVTNVDAQGKVRAVLEVYSDVSERKRAQESLRQSQELNERILRSTADAVLVLDLAGRVLFLNPGAERARESGALAVAKGAHWGSFWTASDQAAAEAAHRAALAGEAARFQGAAASNREQPHWWDVALQPINDAAGHPEQLVAVCREVTEVKQAELKTREEAGLAAMRAEIAGEVARGGELDAILQQLAQVMLHHAGASHIRLWLAAGEPPCLRLVASAGLYLQLAGEKTELKLGEGRTGEIAASQRPYFTHQVASDAGICDPAWARRENLATFAGYPLLFESRLLGVLTVVSRDRLKPAMLRELGLSADAIALLIQRKQADEVRARLLREATEARNAAVAASRAKDTFLATLSHELRTPLNPILLIAGEAAGDASLPPEVRAQFETIRNNVSLEARLIDDLLDLTRIANGKLSLEFRPTDVNAVLAAAVKTVSAGAGQIRFALELKAESATVLGDAVRLQQVFWNLLNNAVKFTPAGGTVSVHTADLRPRRLRIEIRDTGIGLRPEDLDRIFDPFLQVERSHGGLGLGLAISRQLMEKHQGTIRASSEGPGKGSAFEIELPLAPEESAADGHGNGNGNGGRAKPASGSPPEPSGSGRRRLLLIEDHASTRETLQTLLGKRDFEVVTAASAAEARELFRQRSYDLVLSDLGLPDVDGCQLLAEMRRERPGIRAIAVSGYGTASDQHRAREAGFAGHLTKPISMAALDQAIARAFSHGED
ncbi:MAG TPA: chemotaxis protein CheB [Opitutaceae bacterium]|nr:chemotaxis protein CheB [Opitutaceae bacterium]